MSKTKELMTTNTTNLTRVELTNLHPYTEYTVEITACNILEFNVPGCGKKKTTSTFNTQRGRPGQPGEPTVSFTNATNVELRWDANFPVSAKIILSFFS